MEICYNLVCYKAISSSKTLELKCFTLYLFQPYYEDGKHVKATFKTWNILVLLQCLIHWKGWHTWPS